MMLEIAVQVTVEYDEEAEVWYVRDTSLEGLYADAETLDALIQKLAGMAFDLSVDEDDYGRLEGKVTVDMNVVPREEGLLRKRLVEERHVPVSVAA